MRRAAVLAHAAEIRALAGRRRAGNPGQSAGRGPADMTDAGTGILLAHMLDATRQAQAFVEGMDRDDFHADKRTQQAVTLNLIIIGEAASRMMERYPEYVAAHPEIEWRAMRGMRNRVAHGYYDIDMDIVWQTLTDALPRRRPRRFRPRKSAPRARRRPM